MQKGCLTNNKEAKQAFGLRLTIFFVIADTKVINQMIDMKISHFQMFPKKQKEKKGNKWKRKSSNYMTTADISGVGIQFGLKK